MLSNPADQIRGGHLARVECVHVHADRLLNADGIGKLYLAAPGKTVPQDILGDLPGHVRAAPVDLCRVFSGESAAAMPAGTTIGVTHDLPTRDACVCKAPSGYKSPGGIHQHTEILIQVMCIRDVFHNPLAEVKHIIRFHVFFMLCADQEGVDAAATVIVGHLCFCIRQQGRMPSGLQTVDGFRRQHEGQRKHFPGFLCGVAEHHALIASALLVYTKGDVPGLL